MRNCLFNRLKVIHKNMFVYKWYKPNHTNTLVYKKTTHEYNLINSSDTEEGAKTPKSVIKKVIYSGGK